MPELQSSGIPFGSTDMLTTDKLAQPPREVGTVTPPDLGNPDLYIVKPGVPILKTHTYKQKTTVGGIPKTIVREIDEERLNLIVANSNQRAANADYGLIFLGHTDDEKPEDEQPPIVGYMKDYRVGEWAGKPCVLADFYIDKARKAEAATFPRRSAETWYHESEPDRNFIDAVSLLKRTPEQDLGLLTFENRNGVKLRFAAIGDEPQTDEGAMGLSDDDLTKIGEMISTAFKAGFELFGKMQNMSESAAATQGEGAAAEQNDMDDDGTSDSDEPSMEQAEAPPTTDNDDEKAKEKNEAGSTPSGTNTFVPGDDDDEKGKEKMAADCNDKDDDGAMEKNRMKRDSDNIALSRYEKRLNALEKQLEKTQAENATLQRNARKDRRERDLIQLEAEGYVLDRAEELEDGLDKDDSGWGKQIGRIKARYSRNPIDADEIRVTDKRPGLTGDDDAMDEDEALKDRAAFLKFCRENPMKSNDPSEVVEAWQSHRKKLKSGATA